MGLRAEDNGINRHGVKNACAAGVNPCGGYARSRNMRPRRCIVSGRSCARGTPFTLRFFGVACGFWGFVTEGVKSLAAGYAGCGVFSGGGGFGGFEG